jgi:hypothetical protein
VFSRSHLLPSGCFAGDSAGSYRLITLSLPRFQDTSCSEYHVRNFLRDTPYKALSSLDTSNLSIPFYDLRSLEIFRLPSHQKRTGFSTLRASLLHQPRNVLCRAHNRIRDQSRSNAEGKSSRPPLLRHSRQSDSAMKPLRLI